jgi:hypothetical protein
MLQNTVLIIEAIILFLIIKRQNKMSQEFEQLKNDIIEINGIVVNVGEDVTTLQTTIDNLLQQGQGATPEQIAELQVMVTGIKSSLQSIDEKTVNPTPPVVEEGEQS